MIYILYRVDNEFFDALISRLSSLVAPADYGPDQIINGRGPAIAYASLVGGSFGDGPGTYSDIYGLFGPSTWLLDYIQITIARSVICWPNGVWSGCSTSARSSRS